MPLPVNVECQTTGYRNLTFYSQIITSLPSHPRNQKEAVVVSSRALYNNELFEVELGNEAESMVSNTGSIRRKKTNAGAIRIGVTGHR